MRKGRLGSLTKLSYGKSLKDYKDNNPLNFPVRVFGTNGPIGWTKKALFKGPKIIIGRKGAYRETHWAESDAWVIDTAYYLDLLSEEIDLRWLFWKLKSIDLNKLDSGSAIPSTKKEDFYSIEILYPDISSQKKIAAILSAYDDLIENNRRRIELLEESARLLYQEWFVRLRFPGHETTRIINGIPEGWGEFCLEDFFSIKHGYAFRGEFFSETPTNRILLTPGNFKIGGGIKLDKLKFYSEEEEVKEEYILRINDLVLTMTDLSKESDTLGYPLLVPNFGENVFLHNQRLGKIIFKDDDFLRFLFFYIMQDPRYRAFVVGSASGTSVKHTSPGRILAYKTILPKDFSMEFLKHFNMIVKNNQFQIYNLFLQNQKLAEARDLLLPRLMSGEIEV